MRIGRRITAAVLGLALLMQGQVVTAMDCHGNQEQTSLHDHGVVEPHGATSPIDLDRPDPHSESVAGAPQHDHHGTQNADHGHQGCVHCASGCLMAVVIPGYPPDPSQTFRSPSPSVITSIMALGETPDGLLRPPR